MSEVIRAAEESMKKNIKIHGFNDRGFYITDTLEEIGMYYLHTDGIVYNFAGKDAFWPNAREAQEFWNDWKKA